MGDIPAGLDVGGAQLWSDITDSHELNATQRVQLLEACRAKDRLDKLDDLLRGEIITWAHLTHRLLTNDYELKIDQALSQANSTANLLKQLLAALRLPDEVTGKRPITRPARGAYVKSNPAGTVSAIDRARSRSAG